MMRRLVDTEEAAKILGITTRAIQKWFKRGKLEGQVEKSTKGGGRSGQVLKVYIDDTQRPQNDPSAKVVKDPTPQKPVHQMKPVSTLVTREDAEEVRRRLRRKGAEMQRNGDGETDPLASNITSNQIPMSNLTPSNNVNLEAKNNDFVKLNAETGLSVKHSAQFDKNSNLEIFTPFTPAAPPATLLTPPQETTLTPGGAAPPLSMGDEPGKTQTFMEVGTLPQVSPKSLRVANLRFALIQAFNEEIAKNGRSKTEVLTWFIEGYNSGIILPKVGEELKHISRSTLYNWLQLCDRGGIEALAPQYRGATAAPIAEAEKKFLLTRLLDQNKHTIGDTINKCKFLLGESSPSHPSKLRRFVNDFRSNNYDLWTLEREGEKALNDKCVPYAEREWRDLAVGEAVVADGHKLNFQVINPFTGKPCRAMMVLFWDWKSAFPLGWEVMLTESIQCVVAALRNAVITLGKFPKHALVDNGKAFRANIFRKQFRFQETEIPGIFEKLAIIPHYAMPYNAQSKPVERFFRTFNDWFERELPSYTGASIPDKPAHMNRNEKRAKELHAEWVPTIPEAMELIFRWREYYASQPSRARDGQRPRDLFEAEKGPGVDPFALHFLMMTCKARMVHRNGITFNGWHWYHESLYGLKDTVLMFYSYYDLSQVYIFTMENEFLCVARPVEKLMPFASDSEFPEDMAAVKQINATKRRVVKTTKKLADMLQSEKKTYIDWDRQLRDRPEVAAAIQQIEDKSQKVAGISPFLDGVDYKNETEARRKYKPPREWQGYYEYWERYEHHLKQHPKELTKDDDDFIVWYKNTDEYRRLYCTGPTKIIQGGNYEGGKI